MASFQDSPIYDPAITKLVEALRGVLTQVAEPVYVLRTILEQAVVKTQADHGVFVEVDRSGRLEYRVLHRFDQAELNAGGHSFSRTIFADVLRTGEPAIIENALDDPRYLTSTSVQALRMVSVLTMPIRAGGRIVALVHLERDRPGYFTREHLDRCGPLLEVAAPVLEALRTSSRVLEERERFRQSASVAEHELNESREILARDWSFGRFLGRSRAVREMEETVLRIARTDAPVLIEGETGTGKSLLARILHHSGPRADRPFVTVFCPALERGMVETALFGHRRGAFTGAGSDAIGKVQAAERGTLFLDEVGEIPPDIQPKLLRLLHEKVYERVGDPAERAADVRILAATNRDLAAEVRAGRFRLDLYERLRFLFVRVPPVRERREDIPALLRHALDHYANGRWLQLSPEAERFLSETEELWPGNVREIEQLAARLGVSASSGPITPADLERLLDREAARPVHEPRPASGAAGGAGPGGGLTEYVESAEREFLVRALGNNPGLSRAELAVKLRIGERTLYKKLVRHGLGG